jgi:hypothetical protein
LKPPGLRLNFYLLQTCKFEIISARIHGENFAIFDSEPEGPSVQALEIIRHVDASLGRKKSRWDYQYFLHSIDFLDISPHGGQNVMPGVRPEASSLVRF